MRRTTSFIANGSMIEVVFPIRLLTATHFPSGETPSWCGSLPTAIFPTRAYGSPGLPSSTQTWSVLSEATKMRSFEYSGAGDGAGFVVGVAVVDVAGWSAI